MKKTKIVCSIGPASSNVEVMSKMVEEGMDVARINFSHSTEENSNEILSVIKETEKKTGKNIAILFDTKGPDFRCGLIKEGGIPLIKDEIVKIVKDDITGDNGIFTVNYKDALDKINVGNIILIDDALMRLEVVAKDNSSLSCKVIDGGVLTSKKGINVPGVNLGLSFISEADLKDIKYACSHDGDFLALSFVETSENVEDIRRILKENGAEDMNIISKIETKRALENLDAIIDASDGIMVARGDLGVEVDVERLPIIQKDMIKRCREKGKFVIVATEMLASMYESARPTRAEVTDISNAVLDGTDAVMLSGESTVGKHPIEAVKYMARICEEAERNPRYATKFERKNTKSITERIGEAVLTSAESMDIKAIVVPTSGGHSASVMSNLRPETMILAICPNEKVARKLAINYGIVTEIVNIDDNDLDDMVYHCRKEAIKFLNLQEKDVIVITGGIHVGRKVKQTNFLKIEEI